MERVIVKEIECKSILTKSGIPEVDYALNPYVGCQHACVYCYASFMKRFTGHKERWGSFVDVKRNAPDVLRRQLRRVVAENISFGTVTDPYQPLESKYEVTRRCLEVLVDFNFPVEILTKSSLVLKDIDLLKRQKRPEVGFTVTTLDPEVKQAFEPYSSSSEERLDALRVLLSEGIKTWLFFGPVLPHFSDNEGAVDEVFEAAAEAKVDHVLVDILRPYPSVWRRVRQLLLQSFPEALPVYKSYHRNWKKPEYGENLRSTAIKAAERHRVACRFGF